MWQLLISLKILKFDGSSKKTSKLTLEKKSSDKIVNVWGILKSINKLSGPHLTSLNF